MLAAIEWDELRRWTTRAAVALLLHVAGVAMLIRWQEPLIGDEGTDAIVLDLEPFTSPPSESKQDIAPGPEQQEEIETPQETQPREQEEVQEEIEPTPPTPNPDVTLPEEPKPDAPTQEVTPPVQEATAPPPPRPSATKVTSWYRQIAAQIERHKRYPSAARARRETGITHVGFAIDRQGMVLASRIVRGSGYPALDQEAIATAQRAQPFPPPPPNLPGATFEFSVPIRFKLQ